MTSDELAEIEARANAATPGPWSRTLTPGRDKARAWLLEAFDASDGDGIHGAAIAAPGKTIEEECLSTAITGNGPTSEANAIFIAHARTDVERLVAEVRRLREENAVLARKLEATAVSVGGPHVEYSWTTGGSEVDRLRTIIRDLDRKHTGALKERNAARADLARAIELLRCITETPTPIPGVTLGDYHEHVAAFLAEMGKR